MDYILAPSWTHVAIVLLIALLSTWTMGAFSSKNQMPVEGKTVLITGASEGMGRSAAIQMAQKGANVILVSRTASKLEAVVAECQAAARNPQTQRFHYLTADVSKPDYAPPLLAEAVAWNNGQPLDIVWCVAGTSTPDFWIEVPLSKTRSQMDINFWGSAEMAHAILRLWCAQDAPVVPEPKHLIFTSSVLALFPVVGYGPYTPAKCALRGLADTLAQELEAYPQKVKVHVVYPASIGSPGFERENRTKPEITKMLEEGDPVQSPDAVAAAAIKKLEAGQYFITVAFLGHIFRWSVLGGSPRNNWFVDTIMCCLIPIVWIFALPDIFSKIRKYAKKHGHPASYRSKNIAGDQS
ncbi:NAD(P)-binding protein [Hypoxylon sp. FL0543]|nr:NAD(P)-binding protein [Hypoxylon sp. FL0543]